MRRLYDRYYTGMLLVDKGIVHDSTVQKYYEWCGVVWCGVVAIVKSLISLVLASPYA